MVSNLKQLRPQLGFAFHQLSSFKSPTFILAAIMTSRTKIPGKSTILFAFIFIGLSSGAPPLDVSEFFGIPAAAAAPEPEVSIPPQSKARNGAQSDLLAQLLSSLGKFKPSESLFHLRINGRELQA